MKAYSSKSANKGFTIVELLTVISVIAILIGLMVPALQEVKKIAKDIQQKAQFHSISVALDIFQNEVDSYPESSNDSAGDITGAHRLAEALVGRDLQGFDPISDYDPDTNYLTPDAGYVYAEYDSRTAGNPSFKDISLERRRGPYLNLEKGGAYDLNVVYDGYDNGSGVYMDKTFTKPAPVLVDVYRHVKRTYSVTSASGTTRTETIKVGAPVLYFKANTASNKFGDGSTAITQDTTKYIYNQDDNELIFNLLPVTAAPIPGSDNPCLYSIADKGSNVALKAFYDDITNPQIPTIERPYNSDTYLLLSAGADAIYGTSDDIWNFGE